MLHKRLAVVGVAMSFLALLAPETQAQAPTPAPATVLHVTNNTGVSGAFTVRFIRSDGQTRIWKTPRSLAPGETASFKSGNDVIASRRENNTTYYLIWVYGVPQDGGMAVWWGKNGNDVQGIRGIEWTTDANNGVSRHVSISLR